MTGPSSGGWRNGGRSPLSSLIERASATLSKGRRDPRPLDQIMPERGDEARARDMQATWQAFCLERHDALRGIFDRGRSPPEIAYGIGELLHTYFRTRGVTLTSQELRRLVAEIVEAQIKEGASAAPAAGTEPPADAPKEEPAAPAVAEAPPTAVATSSTTPVAEAKSTRVEETRPAPLVSFADEPTAGKSTWTGAETAKVPVVPDEAFEAPSSPLVSLVSRDEASFDRLLSQTLDTARPRLGAQAGKLARTESLRAIDAAVDEVLRGEGRTLPPDLRERLVLSALSEMCGLGLIDQLWADRSVTAVFVNGPSAVYVERAGGVEPAPEAFRDRAHLLEVASRLAGSAPAGIAEVQLRDGATATVIFPPAAPEGPVLVLRRGEPGRTTFERLVAADVIDRPIANLLRIAARARLNVLIVGPAGSGKSSLLAAIGRDLGAEARVVTLAANRDFRWNAPTKVELVATPGSLYAPLISAAMELRPHTLVLDALPREDAAQLVEHLAAGARGVVAGCEPSAVTPALMRSVDLVVRLGRSRDGLFRPAAVDDAAGVSIFVYEDGRFQRRGSEPAFAEAVRAAGLGEALANLLR